MLLKGILITLARINYGQRGDKHLVRKKREDVTAGKDSLECYWRKHSLAQEGRQDYGNCTTPLLVRRIFIRLGNRENY